MQNISKKLVQIIEIIEHSIDNNQVGGSVLKLVKRLTAFIKDVMIDKNRLLLQILNLNDERCIDEFVLAYQQFKERNMKFAGMGTPEDLKRKRNVDLARFVAWSRANFDKFLLQLRQVDERWDRLGVPFVPLNLDANIFNGYFVVRKLGYD